MTLYDRFARVLLIVALLTATGGVIIGTTATVQNARQDQANAALLECLNDYAADNSSTNAAVRDASVRKDLKLAAFYVALNAEGEAFLTFLNQLTAGKVDGPGELAALRSSLARRASAGDALEAAQDALDQVREDNPITPPPAVFCDLEEKRP